MLLAPAIVVLASSFLLSGCHPAMTPLRPAASSSIQLSAAPLTSLKTCHFLLQLDDQQHRPVNATNVRLSLTMTTMFMPPNTIAMRAVGPGRYTGEGIFTMDGPWQATVSARVGGTARNFGSLNLIVSN